MKCPMCGAPSICTRHDTTPLTVPKWVLQCLLDAVATGPGAASGHLEEEEVLALREAATLIGVDPMTVTPDDRKESFCPGHVYGEPLRDTRYEAMGPHPTSPVTVQDYETRTCQICEKEDEQDIGPPRFENRIPDPTPVVGIAKAVLQVLKDHEGFLAPDALFAAVRGVVGPRADWEVDGAVQDMYRRGRIVFESGKGWAFAGDPPQ